MRSRLSICLLVCSFFAVGAVCDIATLSLEEVNSEIATFIETAHNGTLGVRGVSFTPPSGCSLACSFLNFALAGTISFPGSSIYQAEESGYWSFQQATTSPTCRFTPKTSLDVSLGVLTSRVTQCKFAVKSGGHAAFAGASNIEGGLTFDLKNLNQVMVSPDRTKAAIGAGNTWYDVYTHLEPSNITVIGGRVAAIGVGGLTLGGGISFFSNRYGWACDNVNTYEVVFADGTIHNVTHISHPDLYWALRGGGNNFGIVTRFDMATYAQGELWAGMLGYIWSETTETSLNEAFYHLNINTAQDPYAQLIYVFAYANALGGWLIASELQYGKPVINPPIFQNFTNIPGPIIDTMKVQNPSSLTMDFNNSNPSGYRQTYWALMVKNSPTLLHEIITIYRSEITPLITPSEPANFLPSLIFQPISLPMMSHFTKNGGNSLGLSSADGPLNLINLSTSWSNEADDERIFKAMRNVVRRVNETAWKQGLGSRYLYQNYAAGEQDVFASYGEESLRKLRATSRRYDPEGVWQRLQPGYFKLW